METADLALSMKPEGPMSTVISPDMTFSIMHSAPLVELLPESAIVERMHLSPLLRAIELGKPNVIVELIKVARNTPRLTINRLMELSSLAIKHRHEYLLDYLYILYHAQSRPIENADLAEPQRLVQKLLSGRDGIFNTLSFHNNIEVMKLVVSHFPDVDAYLHLAIRPGNEEFFVWLLNGEAKIELSVDRRSALLHHAILIDDWPFVCLLMSRGAQPNTQMIADLFSPMDRELICENQVVERRLRNYQIRSAPYERDVIAYVYLFHSVGVRPVLPLADVVGHSQGILILEALRRVNIPIKIDVLINEVSEAFSRERVSAEQTERVYQLIPFIDFLLEFDISEYKETFLEKLILFDYRAVEYYLDRMQSMGKKFNEITLGKTLDRLEESVLSRTNDFDDELFISIELCRSTALRVEVG